MYCPACAAEVVDDQRYCRSCGSDLRPEEPRRGSNPFRRMYPGFILMMLGVIVGIIDKKAIHNDIVGTIASVVAVLGIFWIALAALRLGPAAVRYDRQLLSGRKAKKNAALAVNTQVPRASTSKLTAGETFEPASVVEGTTELLKTPNKSSRT